MTDSVLFTQNVNGMASIVLNRPKALNALTTDMIISIKKKLRQWENDSTVACIVLKGNGGKGFCAGGDIKALYEAQYSTEALLEASFFFKEEYALDLLIATFPKPILAIMDGIVMGGGIGLANGCSHRLVTESTKWAMPETRIGFFPDVGCSYYLNRAPGMTGRYLALTADPISAADALFIGVADLYISEQQLPSMLTLIEQIDWLQGSASDRLDAIIADYRQVPDTIGFLSKHQEEIDAYFAKTSVEEIVDALEQSQTPFAMATKEKISANSPFSLKLTLHQMIESQQASLEECFRMDTILAGNFMKHPDFFEGVRSVLIEKNHSPNYQYKHLSAVSLNDIWVFFQPKKAEA